MPLRIDVGRRRNPDGPGAGWSQIGQDIAGQGIANPIGQIWCGAMMLDHLGEKAAAASIVAAIERTLGERTLRTRDLGGNADTTACGKAVAEMVD